MKEKLIIKFIGCNDFIFKVKNIKKNKWFNFKLVEKEDTSDDDDNIMN